MVKKIQGIAFVQLREGSNGKGYERKLSGLMEMFSILIEIWITEVYNMDFSQPIILHKSDLFACFQNLS